MTAYYRVTSAAVLLSVSVDTIRRWVASNRLPAKRTGRIVLIAHEDLDAFVRAFPPACKSPRSAHVGQVVSLDRAREIRDLARQGGK